MKTTKRLNSKRKYNKLNSKGSLSLSLLYETYRNLYKLNQNSPTANFLAIIHLRTLTQPRPPFTPNLSTIFHQEARFHHARCKAVRLRDEGGYESRFYRTIGSGRRVILPTRRSTEIDEDPPPPLTHVRKQRSSPPPPRLLADRVVAIAQIPPPLLSPSNGIPRKFQFLSFPLPKFNSSDTHIDRKGGEFLRLDRFIHSFRGLVWRGRGGC